METPELPWAPLYTVTRSELPEVTVSGIAYVWAEDRQLYSNAGRSLLRLGDTRALLWSRSLLKPWQFMVIYPTLKAAYPELKSEHYALMIASQQGDPAQFRLLEEIAAIGGFTESDLKCPACETLNLRNSDQSRPLNHTCAGKHFGYLLYGKAKGLSAADYLNPSAEPYRHLQTLLDYLMNREVEAHITTDGCGMPNCAFSAVELAQLYHALAMPLSKDMLRQCPDELTDILSGWDEVSNLIRKHPELIGGAGRLDTRLMQGQWQTGEAFPVVAKEGADGLLAAGIGANAKYPDGLGILIKLASGYNLAQFETVAMELLRQLGLAVPAPPETGVVKTRFHFQLAPGGVATRA